MANHPRSGVTMKKFTRAEIDVWVGTHRSMGVLVYDPHAQIGVSSEKVRLYVIAQKRMASFIKDIARDRLSGEEHRDLEAAANVYLDLRGRFTHCYSCKRDLNSIDFSVCDKCGWIT